MKFKINKFDRMVGIFSIISLAGLLVLIFSIGSTQKWFTRKNKYYTFFDTAAGISQGMDLTYKGFSIGKIKKITLVGHEVRADFYILSDYEDYVKEGSLVQLITSPIGLGSSFVLHPGFGEGIIPPGSELYRHDSEMADLYFEQGLNELHDQSDSIGLLMGKVSVLMDNVNRILSQLNEAFAGRGKGELAGIVSNINALLGNIEKITNIQGPDEKQAGLLRNILGEDINSNLNEILLSLSSITGGADSIVGNLDPEVQSLMLLLQNTLLQVQDVLTGLKNNPLIKNGVPERGEATPASEISRGTDF